MTDQTPQGGLYGPQSAPDDSRAAEGATKAGDGRTAGRAEAGRREQYAAVISRVLLDSAGRLVPKHIAETAKAVADSADAVLAVRDREMELLRERVDELEQRAADQSDEIADCRVLEYKAELERAEAAIARMEDLAGRLELAQYGVDLEADSIRRAIARDVRAALDQQQEASR